MKLAVRLEPAMGSPRVGRSVEYRWDPDTEILSAQLAPFGTSTGVSGTVGVEGRDGSWLILDVAADTISGVEVAVWPEVQTRSSLAPPSNVEDADVFLAANGARGGIGSLEMDTRLVAESDDAQRTIHFRLGHSRVGQGRTIRLGQDLLLDVDEKSQISGLWLLNVPPCPAES